MTKSFRCAVGLLAALLPLVALAPRDAFASPPSGHTVAAFVETAGRASEAREYSGRRDVDPKSILVLGDSFSAGNGGGAYYGPGKCYRSTKNYGWVLGRAVGSSDIRVGACSGAVAHDVRYPNPARNLQPQVSHIAGNEDLILLSIGGNDADFSRIVKQCLVRATDNAAKCDKALAAAERDLLSGLLARTIRDALRVVKQVKAARTRVGLVGYPFLEGHVGYVIVGPDGKRVQVGRRLMAIQRKADAVERDLVVALGDSKFRFFSLQNLYDGPPFHGLYADGTRNPNSWLVKPGSTISIDTYYHPNPAGWAATGKMLAASKWITDAFLSAPDGGGGEPTEPGMTALTLGPRATGLSASGAVELDYFGRTLLHDDSCYGLISDTASTEARQIGDTGVCFQNDMTSDGTQVYFAQYARSSLVAAGQRDCPDPLGYLYRWSAPSANDWVDLDGACFNQGFKISDNGRFLFVVEDSERRLVVHDRTTGGRTEIMSDCGCTPIVIADNGASAIFHGKAPAINSAGQPQPDGTEGGLFLWERGSGTTLIAGGDALSYSVGAFAASADASTVIYQVQPDDGVYRPQFYRWTRSRGAEQLSSEIQFVPRVSISADGGVIAITYDRAGESRQVGIIRGAETQIRDLASLGIAPSSADGVVSGDGKTIAFTTEETLLPTDQDTSTAYDADADWYFVPTPQG